MDARVSYTERIDGRIDPPSSKNYTTRYLLAAALADGESIVRHAAKSEDADALIRCLRGFGAEVTEEELDDESSSRHLKVHGFGRTPKNPGVVDAGNAGAVLRFLLGVGALLNEVEFSTDFEDSLGQRPHADLLEALQQLGARSESRDGKLPILIRGGDLRGGRVRVSGATSSQYLSSLLFLAPLIGEDVEIEVIDDLVSKPLVRTTLEVMETAGIQVEASEDLMRFAVAAGQFYRPGEYSVNGDYPSAAAILAAAAITGSSVTVERLFEDRQGERAVLGLLQSMGVDVSYDGSEVQVRGHRGLRGIEFDGDTATDMVLAMLPVAALAEGQTRFFGVGNLRHKECDRIAVPIRELRRLGVDCDDGEGEILIRGRPSGYDGGGEADTYHDHRVAQMLTLMGLRCRHGLTVRNADTVAKSYPQFFDDLISLGARIEMDNPH